VRVLGRELLNEFAKKHGAAKVALDTWFQFAKQADWKRIYRLQDELCHLIKYDAIALNNQLLWENLLISWDRL